MGAWRARPQQALTCIQLVLVLTCHAPKGAQVPAVSGWHGPARVCASEQDNRSPLRQWLWEGVKPHICGCELVSVGLVGAIGEVSGNGQFWASRLEAFGGGL